MESVCNKCRNSPGTVAFYNRPDLCNNCFKRFIEDYIIRKVSGLFVIPLHEFGEYRIHTFGIHGDKLYTLSNNGGTVSYMSKEKLYKRLEKTYVQIIKDLEDMTSSIIMCIQFPISIAKTDPRWIL